MTCECSERQAIVDVLNAYATCLDARDWSGLNDVFHPDAVGIYAATLTGRAAIIESIRSFLDGCGPSQHLLGNYQIRSMAMKPSPRPRRACCTSGQASGLT